MHLIKVFIFRMNFTMTTTRKVPGMRQMQMGITTNNRSRRRWRLPQKPPKWFVPSSDHSDRMMIYWMLSKNVKWMQKHQRPVRIQINFSFDGYLWAAAYQWMVSGFSDRNRPKPWDVSRHNSPLNFHNSSSEWINSKIEIMLC